MHSVPSKHKMPLHWREFTAVCEWWLNTSVGAHSRLELDCSNWRGMTAGSSFYKTPNWKTGLSRAKPAGASFGSRGQQSFIPKASNLQKEICKLGLAWSPCTFKESINSPRLYAKSCTLWLFRGRESLIFFCFESDECYKALSPILEITPPTIIFTGWLPNQLQIRNTWGIIRSTHTKSPFL